MQTMGTNQLLCADPRTREVRRFLVGPRGCEITGVITTPDQRTMFVNVQHPGEQGGLRLPVRQREADRPPRGVQALLGSVENGQGLGRELRSNLWEEREASSGGRRSGGGWSWSWCLLGGTPPLPLSGSGGSSPLFIGLVAGHGSAVPCHLAHLWQADAAPAHWSTIRLDRQSYTEHQLIA